MDEEDSDIDDEEEEEVKLTKQNYPTDWSGNPIPFWLYKVPTLALYFFYFSLFFFLFSTFSYFTDEHISRSFRAQSSSF